MKSTIILLGALFTLASCSEKEEIPECCKSVIEVNWEWANANLDGKNWETTIIDCNNNVSIVDNGFSYYAPYEVGDRVCD